MKRLLLAAIAFVAVALSTTAAPAQSSGPGSSLVFFPSGGATGGSYRPLPLLLRKPQRSVLLKPVGADSCRNRDTDHRCHHHGANSVVFRSVGAFANCLICNAGDVACSRKSIQSKNR